MNLFIIFSIVFAVIIFAIVLQRIIHCPILVGFAIFAALLIVAAVFNNTTFVIIAIALGILAFIVAFLDCIFRNSNFLRNNRCLTCECDNNNNNNNDDSDDTLTIVNSNGTVLARIMETQFNVETMIIVIVAIVDVIMIIILHFLMGIFYLQMT